jgi:hypothetical protein
MILPTSTSIYIVVLHKNFFQQEKKKETLMVVGLYKRGRDKKCNIHLKGEKSV